MTKKRRGYGLAPRCRIFKNKIVQNFNFEALQCKPSTTALHEWLCLQLASDMELKPVAGAMCGEEGQLRVPQLNYVSDNWSQTLTL